jgi:UPF0271 protein
MPRIIDVNADVGEGCGQDVALMPLISSANIACGYHAGDAASMREAVVMARDCGVAVGAHPSFPDREHFGRRDMQLTPAQIDECIAAQVSHLAEIAASEGVAIRHVKPHGALYNMAARDEQLADTLVRAIRRLDPALRVFALAGSALLKSAEQAGLRAVSEVFADRAYQPDGRLVPRDRPGGVIHEEAEAAVRAAGMALHETVVAVDGTSVTVRADTICIHGDTPGAASLARRVRERLDAAGITVAPPR